MIKSNPHQSAPGDGDLGGALVRRSRRCCFAQVRDPGYTKLGIGHRPSVAEPRDLAGTAPGSVPTKVPDGTLDAKPC